MLRRLHLVVLLIILAFGGIGLTVAPAQGGIFDEIGGLFGINKTGARSQADMRNRQQSHVSARRPSQGSPRPQPTTYQPWQQSQRTSTNQRSRQPEPSHEENVSRKNNNSQSYYPPGDEFESADEPEPHADRFSSPSASGSSRSVASSRSSTSSSNSGAHSSSAPRKPTYHTSGTSGAQKTRSPHAEPSRDYEAPPETIERHESGREKEEPRSRWTKTANPSGTTARASSAPPPSSTSSRSSGSARARLGQPTSRTVDEVPDEEAQNGPDLAPPQRTARAATPAPYSHKLKRPEETGGGRDDISSPQDTASSSRRSSTPTDGTAKRSETARTSKSVGRATVSNNEEPEPAAGSRQRDNVPIARSAPSPGTKKPYEVSQPDDALKSAFRDHAPAKIGSLAAPTQLVQPQPLPEETLAPSSESHEKQPAPAAAKPAVKAAEISAPRPATSRAAEPSKSLANVLFRTAGPALSVETVGPKHLLVGQETTYKFIASNLGDLAAKNATVTIRIPNWVDVVHTKANKGGAQVAGRDKNIEWVLDRLEGGGRAELEVRIVPRENQPLELEVQWTSGSAASQASIEVREAKLELAISGPKEVDYGQTAIYELTFSNPGNAPAEKVMVRLMPLDESQPPETHEIGIVPAGGKKVVEVELVARHAGQVMIKAEATAEGGLRSSVEREVLVRRAEIAVNVEGPRFRYARTSATYRVTIANPGTGVARAIKATLELPRGGRYVSGVELAQVEDRTVSWTIDSLRPGEERTYAVKCELDVPGANRVQLIAACEGNLRDTSFVTTEVEAVADLVLEVQDPKGPVAVGEDTAYVVTIRNRGTKAAEHVELKAYFSEGIEPVSVDGADARIEPGKVTLQAIPAINAGDEKQIKIVARANQPGNHVFQAELECQALDVRLAAQETTRFYGDSEPPRETPAESAPAGSSRRFHSGKSPADAAQGEPTLAEPAPVNPAESTPGSAFRNRSEG